MHFQFTPLGLPITCKAINNYATVHLYKSFARLSNFMTNEFRTPVPAPLRSKLHPSKQRLAGTQKKILIRPRVLSTYTVSIRKTSCSLSVRRHRSLLLAFKGTQHGEIFTGYYTVSEAVVAIERTEQVMTSGKHMELELALLTGCKLFEPMSLTPCGRQVVVEPPGYLKRKARYKSRG